jgi:general secretion pathway protein G
VTGFSLVELIIVLAILGILATLVISNFGNTSGDTKISAMKTTLQTVRAQLETYRLQHNEKLPTLAAWKDQMTQKTGEDGTADTNGRYGPYLTQMPVNPMDNSSALFNTQNGSGGWAYDEGTGSFKPNDSSVTNSNSATKDL